MVSRNQAATPRHKVSGNNTNTTFATQAIVVNQPTLHQHEPPSSVLVGRQIAHLASQNNLKRREGLAYLVNLLDSPDSQLRDAVQIHEILPHVLQLTLVVSEQVRLQAFNVLQHIPRPLIEEHMERMLPYIRSGLTHLAANVASTSLQILEWLINTCGEHLVSCRGGWVKTLKCFLVMLRWTSETRTGRWTFSRSSIGDGTYHAKSLIKCLEVLALFLRTGLSRPQEGSVHMSEFQIFPLAGTRGALLPTSTTSGFSCLDLFGEPPDNENAECIDVDSRKGVIATAFQSALEQGLAALKQDGGSVGRAAGKAAEILRKGLGNAIEFAEYGANDGTGDEDSKA
ncbi:rRNA processing protein [Lobaria immixta]|nr:rRNA processing protein [Lobaria immixta]